MSFLYIADGSPTFTTTPAPPRVMYEARVKFVELGERYTLPVRGTREYKELQSRYELCGTFQWGNGGLTLHGGVFLSFQGFQGAGSYGDLTGPGLRGGGDSQVQEVSGVFFTSESKMIKWVF